jgi:hypothetical protein
MINWVKRLRKEESGASMVMVALSMVVILGFAALGIDLGKAYSTKVEMQNACDLSALAAATSLPEANATKQVAEQYAELNGFDKDDVEVSIIDGGEKVEVKISQDVKTYFAGVIGFKEVPVSCKAVAAAGESEAKDYAIFSGTTAFFGLHGNVTIPDGDIHANGKGDITGALNINNGVIELPGWNNTNLPPGNYDTYVDADNYIDIPDYSEIISKKIRTVDDEGYTVINGYFQNSEYAKSHLKDGVLTINSDEKVYIKSWVNIWPGSGIDSIVVNGTLKVDGLGIGVPITVNGSMVVKSTPNFGGKTVINGNMIIEGETRFGGEVEISGTLVVGAGIAFGGQVLLNEAVVVSDGQQISFESGAVVKDKYTNGGYSVIWGRGNGTQININADIECRALFYAPTAEIIMSGGNVDVKGSLVGYQIGTDNGNLTVELPKNDERWEFGGQTNSSKNKKTAKLVE